MEVTSAISRAQGAHPGKGPKELVGGKGLREGQAHLPWAPHLTYSHMVSEWHLWAVS